MIRDTSLINRHKFDILVVGGGINGAAIAYLAAENGLSVALIDKGDFGGGTSSKSSKLVHGGIRYLENMEFDLVAEALKERYIQYKNAPHLVKPLEFMVPIYEKDPRPAWMVKTGVSLYDLLAGSLRLGPHRALSAQDVLKEEPALNQEGLKGGVIYFDAQMDDARLCLENVLMAVERGARVANYVEALSLVKENRKTVGIVAKDLLTQEIFEVRAKRVVCALGPWTERTFKEDRTFSKHNVRTTKGVHLVYKGRITQRAVVIQTRNDRRIFFVIPWMGNTLIGTTDTDYSGDPDVVTCDREDVEYLISETRRMFPENGIDPKNVLTTFAGLRPLVHADGQPSKVSRRHEIETVASGVTYVMGGKYTTYRKIAEDCLRKFMYLKSRAPLEYPLYGSGAPAESIPKLAERFDVPEETVSYLIDKYGSRCIDVLELVRTDASMKEPMCDCSPTLRAQAVYSVETEMAQTVDDVLTRRLGLSYLGCASQKCKDYVQKVLDRRKTSSVT